MISARSAFAQLTYDWTGTTNTAWTIASNWSVGGVAQTGTNYPGGAGRTTDIVQVGVDASITAAQFPALSSSLTVASVTYGYNNKPVNTKANMALTINGAGVTLTVTGAFLQMHSPNGGNANSGGTGPGVDYTARFTAITTSIIGNGTLHCGSLIVGDPTTIPQNLYTNDYTQLLIGSNTGDNPINIIVDNDFIQNSVSTRLGGDPTVIARNIHTEVFFYQGTLTIGGTLKLVNNKADGNDFAYSLDQYSPSNHFTIQLFDVVNDAILNLGGAPSVQIGDITSPDYALTNNYIDFYEIINTPHKTSTVNYSGPGNQEVFADGVTGIDNTTAVYQNLGFAGGGIKTVDAGSLSIDGNFNLALTGTGSVDLKTNNPVVNIAGTFTSNSTNDILNQGTAAINITGLATNAGDIDQLSSGASGTIAFNGGFTNTGNLNQTNGDITVTGSVSNTGNLNLGSANFSVSGDYSNSGNYTQTTGTTIFNGTGAQDLAGGAGAGTAFHNVTFSGGSNKTLQSGNFSVASSAVMTLSGTNTLVTAGTGNLTLISDAGGSATIATLTNGCQVNGSNITVQRYIAALRGYRLMSSPIYAATVGSNNVYSINYLQANTVLTGMGGGFDKVSSPTLYLYREDVPVSNSSFLTGNYRGIHDITTPPDYTVEGDAASYNIPTGNGYLFFFRGYSDKSPASIAAETLTTYVATSATVAATGSLNQGPIIFRDWYNAGSDNLGKSNVDPAAYGFNLTGNPYPSSIDWETFNTTTSGSGIYTQGLVSTVYELNPVTKNYDIYQVGGNSTNNGSRYIATGQGFFVLADFSSALAPQLTFNESAKATAQPAILLMGKPADLVTNNQFMRLELGKDSIDKDNVLIRFNSNAKAGYNIKEDAPYRTGLGAVSLASISSDKVILGINQLPLASMGQTIALKIGATTDGSYILNMKELVGVPQLYDVWLMDAFKKDSVNMRTDKLYNFTIAKSDTNTFGSNRFKLVVRQNPAQMCQLISFNANKVTNKAQVEVIWKAVNEQNYTHYTVERSTDNGKVFEVVGGLTSSGQGTYSLLDKNPANGINKYRLKQEDYNSVITYSNVVTIQYSDKSNNLTGSGHLSVYPNPAVGNINLAIDPKKQVTAYSIRITNSAGTIVKQAITTLPNWQDNVSKLLTGTYLIQVVNNKDNSLVGQTKFVKL